MTSIFTPLVVQPVPPSELRSGAKLNWSPPVQDAPVDRQGFVPSSQTSVSDTKPTSANPMPAPHAPQGKADPETARALAFSSETDAGMETGTREVDRFAPPASSTGQAAVPSPAHAKPADSGRDSGPTISELAFAPEHDSGPDAPDAGDTHHAQAAYRSALETTNAAEPAQLLMTA